MRSAPLSALLSVVLVLATLGAGAAPDDGGPAPEYAQAAAWVCRPGAEQVCETGLDAVRIAPDGSRTAVPFVAAANPAIDCFAVYPTVSRAPGLLAPPRVTPEVARSVRAMAGRLSSRCRVFAPVYRQTTLAHLRERLASGRAAPSEVPYRDVEAAWAWYLAHDNAGRGVVLIGHSQGAAMLRRLLAEHVDGAPAQRSLVAAFLIGDGKLLAAPAGGGAGGTFAHLPLCAAAAQTGCVYGWNAYLAGDDVAERAFGRDGARGTLGVCTNPAAPAGGEGALDAYLPANLSGFTVDAPFVELPGLVTARCAADAQGDVLRVTVASGPVGAPLSGALREASAIRPTWGLHGRDVFLAEGTILDLLDAETRRRTAHAGAR